ncbi:MAG: hypothetical protein AW07_03829 [Candidatus Accumulibacter sp. SK-11]|nr:MAG: hypothetical protein AW07_03829 [Candidatus Accumulibacter sp. SK-11]
MVCWSSAGSLSISSALCSRRSSSRPRPLAGTGTDSSSLARNGAASPFAGAECSRRALSPAAGSRCGGGSAAGRRGTSPVAGRASASPAVAWSGALRGSGDALAAVGSVSRIVYCLAAPAAHSERTPRCTAGSVTAALETIVNLPLPPSRR